MTESVTASPVGLPIAGVSPRPRRPVRVAVAGLGRAGVLHTAVLSTIPDCEVVGVLDGRTSARRSLRGLGYRAASFERIEKLLTKTRPEALFVSTPHDQRARITRLALEAGVAVLVDRPLAASRAEAEELVRLAAERGVPLMCGHPLAYHPVFAAAQRTLASGVLGELRQARSSTYVSWVFSSRQQLAYAPPGSAGGVTAQPASELLFLLIWSLGAPVEVRATWNRVYGEYEDELHAALKLADGFEIGFDTSWSVPGYARPATVIELEGEHGKLLAADDALELDLASTPDGYAGGSKRLGHADLVGGARFDLDGDARYLQDASFLSWATGGEETPAQGARALDVSRTVEALYESARQGGRPVAVPA